MRQPSVPMLLAVYGCLVALWLATFALAGVQLGHRWHLVIALGISSAKTLLIAAVFMHLIYHGSLNRIAACAGVFWLAIMLSLAMSDFLTRDWMPATNHQNPSVEGNSSDAG